MPINAAMPPLPRLADLSPAGVKAWADVLVRQIEIQMQRLNAPGSVGQWDAADYSATRTVSGADSTAQTAAALATLVADLTLAGVIP